jgi:hypothetical protein
MTVDDDTIAYVTMSSDADAANLQQDLDKPASTTTDCVLSLRKFLIHSFVFPVIP